MYTYLTIGLVLFFSAHFYSTFRSRNPDKDMRVRLGDNKFKGIYSLISLAGFIAIIYGFGASRPSEIVFTPPSWGRHATMLLMLLSFICIPASHGKTGYIKSITKHPMTVAVLLWSGAHLLANGERNSLYLFGCFLVWSTITYLLALKRPQEDRPAPKASADIIPIVSGVVLYGLFMAFLHPFLIGVSVV